MIDTIDADAVLLDAVARARARQAASDAETFGDDPQRVGAILGQLVADLERRARGETFTTNDAATFRAEADRATTSTGGLR